MDKGTMILCAACLVGMALTIELAADLNATTVILRYALIVASGVCFAIAFQKDHTP